MKAGLLTRVEEVWRWFRVNACGEGNARRAVDVARALDFPSESAFRTFVRRYYEEFPDPIAGCAKGLFLVTREAAGAGESATRYDRSLGSRAAEDLRRRRTFRRKLFEMGFRWSGGSWIAPAPGRLF